MTDPSEFDIFARYEKFLRWAETLEQLVDAGHTTDDWKMIYDTVFPEISRPISQLNIGLEWCDPDGSYQDDVLAYHNAVQDRADRIREFLEAAGR